MSDTMPGEVNADTLSAVLTALISSPDPIGATTWVEAMNAVATHMGIPLPDQTRRITYPLSPPQVDLLCRVVADVCTHAGILGVSEDHRDQQERREVLATLRQLRRDLFDATKPTSR